MNLPLRLLPILAGIGLFGAALTVLEPAALAAEEAKIIPAPKLKAAESGKQAVAIFAGGCFWGVEGVFSHIKGVKSAVSGYHGDGKANATYDEVSSGSTRHAEAVRVVYDPSQVSYGQLLQVFFSVVADPTTLNRQGPDSGTQYRTAVVPVGKSQAQVARAYIAELDKSGAWKRKIVTAVEPYKAFYPAETYHQDFMFKNPAHPYIVRWDAVKVSNLKRTFPALYIAKPVRG
ncbi:MULTISPECIES: peptide-methionine (S)-S-oxide reductase MsrA [Sphingomonadaceae]|jgi:peptide-methionine (S)-S-oxide reductase|uniref:peptide-methionine (S)-S-oxide reductase MsrA n=4 Tax=Alphaproteobacteria TaxID=28211 RepID=UPI00076ABB1E|nr:MULTISPECIES: peptide-methionine (S)-S-oxide reductase MsrA [Sphingomonadaceae]MAF62926.1 peptide-methionine (S)-S-oxide reductase [Blastomonas sp.]|tara:strand:+ start:115480 stop:116175 length:696 start_codon:yes stop_codon:yes gene_type:complete